ncbi:MAG: transporter ATP-binding protein [Acidimicrobiales bacterium]|nr:transporter ATP-binding protein [Acidimicrobiales bacterium]
MAAAIEVEQLHKAYGTFEAVRGISFRVSTGESVALLGPNGAGKSTTVEVLEGYRRPTSGAVSVLGADPMTAGTQLRRRIGIVLQEAGFPPELTAAELVTTWRRYFTDPMETAEVLDAVGLTARRDVRAKSLSGGEHRRLDLALALVGRPELLFLDEPTTGFDPSARRVAWDLIDGLVGQGMTLLLTTHYLDEAQRLADRILIINEGRIVADGTPDEIGGRGRAPGTVTFSLPDGMAASELPVLPADAAVDVVDRGIRITSTDLVRVSHAITGWALARGLDLNGFRVARPSLEDVYLSIIGEVTPA